MESRPLNAVPHAAPAQSRPETAAMRGAVRTDMPPPVAVAAQAGAEQSGFGRDSRSPGDRQKRSETNVQTDRETGELVYRVIDRASGTTIMQYPYQAVLNLRAYVDGQDRHDSEGSTSIEA